jgi:adenylate cyclase
MEGMKRALGRALGRFGGRWALGLLLTALTAAHTVGYLPSDSIDRLNGFVSGLFMRLEKPVLDPRIVIVDIDDKSLAQVGRFPWSRNVQADLVTRLFQHYRVGAVGFDISFPEADTSSGYEVLERLAAGPLDKVAGLKQQLAQLKPEMDYDGLLAAAMRGHPVVLGYSVGSTQAKGALPPPAFTIDALNGRDPAVYTADGYEANIARLQQAAAGAGIYTALTDADGVIRSSALLMRVGDGFYPSLSLATAYAYLKGSALAPLFGDSVDKLSASQREQGTLDKLLMFHAKGATEIPVGEGITTIVQFRGRGGPDGGAFRYVPAVDVLTGAAPRKHLEGAVVLVGTSASGLKDIRVTPVSSVYPGVEVHANLIKSILDGRFKERPDYALAARLALVLGVGGLLSLTLALLSPLRAIALAVLALAASAGLHYYLYAQRDMVLDSAALLLLIAGLFVLNVAYGYFFEVRKSNALVSRFGEYVAPELVAEMAENPEQYNMDGESRELSVMFVDVRGFTTISEALDPKTLREYINQYLTAMSFDIRDSHRGTLDKYIGDAVMAFWGAPVAFEDHAWRAVATALRMQDSAARLNGEFAARGWPALAIGIGVNSGLMHVGDMGSAIRRAYTVMGDAVNLASRLEGITKVYGVGITVGQATRGAAPQFAYRELDLVRVKGKNEPVAIYEPVGALDAVTADQTALLADWHGALALVRGQQWNAAEAALVRLQALEPERKLYQLYLERIAVYREQPPGADWDGVTTFETK